MRNSEKYKTAEERENAFSGYCLRQDCNKCWDMSPRAGWGCLLKWLDLEAEEEKPLPCPLCGSRMGVHGALLKCTGCKLTFAYGQTTKDVTSAFNRLAKSVMEAK